MATFKFIAFDNKGKKRQGIIEASNKNRAILDLKKKGLYPQEIENIEKKTGYNNFLTKSISFFERISQRERADIFFQLATLINTGIPLTEALYITSEQSSSRKIKQCLLKIKDKISEGMRFSDAAREHKNIFTSTYIRMLEIAERTGKLSEILFKISEREENRSSLNQQMAPIVLYPVFVLTLGMGIVGFLLSYVVPKMEKIFLSFHRELPLVTRILIFSGIFLKKYLFILFTSIISSILLLYFLYLKNNLFRQKADGLFLKIPIYRKILISHFTSNLSFQLDAGINLTEAIITSAFATNNIIFQKFIMEVAEDINEGGPVDKAFSKTKLFDTMFIASLSTGRRSGRLPDFIRRISKYYEKKINTTIKTTISLLEPISILLLGAIVGFIVMSIMLPLFSINQFVK